MAPVAWYSCGWDAATLPELIPAGFWSRRVE